VSLAQATEAGTVYRPDEIAALAEFVHGRGLKLHLDGARLSNALVFLGCEPADLTWRAGVDVLSFGATKNGALAAEAVIFFDPTLAHDFELRRKRAGHLMSKSRYISAQLLAYLESGAWRRNASHANALAQQVAAHARRWLMYPVESNALFLDIGATNRKRLRADGFGFFDWGPADSGHARLVVSWDQPAADVAALCAALDRL
jgi:threonine aldolase